MTSNAVLECKNVWKKIGHHVIIKDLSFSLREGDILGFIGKNGAGKTTSIKLLLGLQSLTGGSVIIEGYDLKKNFSKAIANVGAIIETPDLYMYLTGYENLKISAKLYKVDEERIKEVVKIVGLEKSIHEKVRKYSLGMRQRLGIAISILHKPRILILDEPMNGLDPEGMKDLKELLISLSQKEKMAIMISSHILSELESFCTRICILSEGTIIKDETTEQIKMVTDKMTYIIELDNISLDKILKDYKIIDNNHIRIISTKENLNNIIKSLILNNISIYEIKKELISLEDIFLKISEAKND